MNVNREFIRFSCDKLIQSGVTTGVALAFGNAEQSEMMCQGACDAKGTNAVSKETVFDLASVTKLFLALSYFLAAQHQPIDFEKSLGFYCGNKYPNLKEVSLDDLFHFNCRLVTQKRITACDYETAVNEVLNMQVASVGIPHYSDMNALVLGDVFDEIFGTPFGTFINREMIENLNLKHTFWGTPGFVPISYMNYDNEMVIKEGKLITFAQTPLVVNDKKAEILSDNGKRLCGNAGLFSTAEDIVHICVSLLRRELLSDTALKSIATKPNTNYAQRFGYLSYMKSPVIDLSEINHELSDSAFAISGFTGTYLMVDPLNNCFLFIGGNRLNEKVTFADKEEYILSDNKVVFEDKEYFYTKDYVFMKDRLRDACCRAML